MLDELIRLYIKMSCNARVWDRICKNRCKICVLFVCICQAYKWYSQMKSNFLFVYQQELFFTIGINTLPRSMHARYLEISKNGEYLSNHIDIMTLYWYFSIQSSTCQNLCRFLTWFAVFLVHHCYKEDSSIRKSLMWYESQAICLCRIMSKNTWLKW